MPARTEGIADRLRGLRQRLGLSQQQLATQLGVSFRSVNRWENGHAVPLPLALKQIEKLQQELELETQSVLLQAQSSGSENA